MKPKVSVNIVCYNHEKYIGDAIDSVLNQTFQDFELILLNNGSTDDSLKVMESYNDPRIKLESIYPNKQSTFAGNNCIERGCGEYVALLCSDDIWEPDKLRQQVEYLDKNPDCGVVFTQVQPVLPDGKPINKKKNAYNKQFNKIKFKNSSELLHDMWQTANHEFCCSSACIRRKCIDELGVFDIRSKHIQDFIMWVDILTKYDAFILGEKLTKMRYFPKKDNLSAGGTNTIIASLNEMQLLYQKFKKIDKLDKFLEVFPETKKKFHTLEEKFIPFYLCMLTLSNQWNSNFWPSALTQLYDIMGDESYRKDLEETFDFSFMDLYNISTKVDIYREKDLQRAVTYFHIKKHATMFKILLDNFR